MSDISNRLREVTTLNTKKKQDDNAAWGDIQDLRRGLMVYMDVKFDQLRDEIREIKQILSTKP